MIVGEIFWKSKEEIEEEILNQPITIEEEVVLLKTENKELKDRLAILEAETLALKEITNKGGI